MVYCTRVKSHLRAKVCNGCLMVNTFLSMTSPAAFWGMRIIPQKYYRFVSHVIRECFWERTGQSETFSWHWDSSALGSTNLLQEKDEHRRHSLWSCSCYFSKKLFLHGLLDVMLYIQDPQRNDCWSCIKKMRQSFWVPARLKSLPDILQETEESNWQTANIGGTIFEISCYMKKSARYYGPVGWRCSNDAEELWVTVRQ